MTRGLACAFLFSQSCYFDSQAVGKERRFKTRHALERNHEPITHGSLAPTEEIKRAKFGKLKKELKK